MGISSPASKVLAGLDDESLSSHHSHGHCHGSGEHNHSEGDQCDKDNYDDNPKSFKLFDVIELQSKIFGSQNYLIEEFYKEIRDKRVKRKELQVRRDLFVKQSQSILSVS